MRWFTSAVLASVVLVALIGSCRAQPADLNALNNLAGVRRSAARAMLAYLADTSTPMNAYPALWAPFEIVGEGAVRE